MAIASDSVLARTAGRPSAGAETTVSARPARSGPARGGGASLAAGDRPDGRDARGDRARPWWAAGVAAFLVSGPVFVEAPLVRSLPVLSLLLTLVWVGFGCGFLERPAYRRWGDVLLGFAWSWLAGSIYWGWLRSEPLLHLPVESIGIPFAIWAWRRGWGKIGSAFYLGSLFGTAATDIYFYLAGLIPHWRAIVAVESAGDARVAAILHQALDTVATPWGTGWAIALGAVLLGVGLAALRSRSAPAWAFGGAVLSTILVDGLFWAAAWAA